MPSNSLGFAHERRLEQIADDTRRSLDRIEANQIKIGDRLDQKIDALGTRLDQKIDAVGTRLDQKIDVLGTRLDRRIDSQTKWFVGLLFTLALAMLAGFGGLYQVIARLPHS